MKWTTWIVGFIWLITMLCVLRIPRADFYTLWPLYTCCFAAYVWLIFKHPTISFRQGLCLALIARLATLFFEPLLSDDYFRFIWDGMLMHEGVHPMAHTPAYIMQHPEIMTGDQGLYDLLNSQNYYSVYPPVVQCVFHFSYWINGLNIPGHIITYKLLLIGIDALIIWFLFLLLQRTSFNTNRALWYALNPLVIIEYTGNLHMDGLMISGLLGAVMLAEKKSVVWSSVLMSLSILSKMMTLVLIPFVSKDFYWKRMMIFSLLSISMSVSIFWFSFGLHTGWLDSIQLWFTSFEFNASVYYLIRGIGYWYKGYNVIAQIGPLLMLITFLGMAMLWLRYIRSPNISWSTSMLYVMTFYFLMSTTIHPWYLGLVLVLGIMSHYLYPILWTYLVFLSYSHYTNGLFEENYLLIATEYSVLFGMMFWEWKRNQSRIKLI